MDAETDPADRPALGGRAPGHLGLGAAGELLFASRIALFGYQVYRPLADDRGVDLVVEVGDGQHAMVQVKSVHPGSYVFMRKSTFALKPWITVGLVVFDRDHEVWPSLFLIPATSWLTPVSPLSDHDYEGKKPQPEYGLSIRRNWKQELAHWSATQTHIEALLGAAHRRRPVRPHRHRPDTDIARHGTHRHHTHWTDSLQPSVIEQSQGGV